MAETNRIDFSALKKGMKVRVLKACHDCEEGLRLQEMGLTKGAEFTVVKVAPLGDPVEISLRGYRLCLRKGETRDFELELLP